jgi:CHAD domain-containing protein
MTPKNTTSPDLATRTLTLLLQDILASGRKPLDQPDITDAVAVHDLRKVLKRWRAILRLIGPVIGDEAEALRIEARDLAREMSSARDGRAALEALEDLGEDLPSLSPRSRTTIGERLAELGANAEAAALTPALKARVVEMLGRAAVIVERWPIGRFDSAEVTKQLTTTYRKARAAEPTEWSHADPEALHRFRRRVVEHRYQMELVEPAWPKLIRVWISEAQRLRDRLGAHQDLAVLLHLTAPHQPLAPWRSRLTPLIAERQAAHGENARRLAGRLFAEKPKAFRLRIASLWRHRA